jgi:hypothetical protein
MSINAKKVLWSGVIAALVIIASAAAMVPLVGNEMDQALADRGLPPLGGPAMAFFGVFSLVMGIVLVWLYAVMKAHFGPGKKTAAIASFVVWFLAYFFSNAAKVAYGFLPLRLTAIGTAWGLVEVILAGLIGAHLLEKMSGLPALGRSSRRRR